MSQLHFVPSVSVRVPSFAVAVSSSLAHAQAVSDDYAENCQDVLYLEAVASYKHALETHKTKANHSEAYFIGSYVQWFQSCGYETAELTKQLYCNAYMHGAEKKDPAKRDELRAQLETICTEVRPKLRDNPLVKKEDMTRGHARFRDNPQEVERLNVQAAKDRLQALVRYAYQQGNKAHNLVLS